VNTNNCLNEKFPSFNSLNKEISPGFCLVDTFSDHFSFLSVNQKDSELLNAHQDRLDNIYKDSLVKQDTILIISDVSIKNNIAILISHISKDQEITKQYI